MSRIYSEEINESMINKSVMICGWVHNRRDHGGVIFLDIRDSLGLVQVIFEPEHKEVFSQAEQLRHEYVVRITGVVRHRPEGMVNYAMVTGSIEIVGKSLELFNSSETPPFLPDEHQVSNDDLRYRYRYID